MYKLYKMMSAWNKFKCARALSGGINELFDCLKVRPALPQRHTSDLAWILCIK